MPGHTGVALALPSLAPVCAQHQEPSDRRRREASPEPARAMHSCANPEATSPFVAGFILGTKLFCLATSCCRELKPHTHRVSNEQSEPSNLFVCLLFQFSRTAKTHQKTVQGLSVLEARKVNLVGRVRMQKRVL